MKKKLKVKKAFAGKMMKAAPAQARRVIGPQKPLTNLFKPQQVLPRPPGTVPGSGGGTVLPGQINPFKPGGSQQPGIKQPIPRDPGYGSGPMQQPGSSVFGPRGPRQIQQPGFIGDGPPRDPNFFSTTPPRPGMFDQAIGPGIKQPFTPQAGAITNPIRQPGGMGPLPNNLGPMQGVGDPRLGAATIPGNQAQMQMRNPTQAAPVQPVPAMKRGGVVRGGRKETKGLRKAKLY